VTRPSTQNSPFAFAQGRRNTQSQSFSAVSAVSALIVVFAVVVFAVVNALQGVPQTPPTFDSNRAWEHLRQLVAIGPRPAGSAAIEQTRKYIKAQLAAAGVAVAEQVWDEGTPIGNVRMVNLVATIPGARPPGARADRVIISGHYDTKLFRDSRFVGANDGGSSAAFLLEIARVLKARRNALTIELLFLDGEEAFCLNWDDCGRPGAPDNTYGSRHYVTAGKRAGTLAGIKANILVDLIADRDLRLKRDLNSTPWLTDILWAAARARKLDTYFVPETTQVEDDHIPFMQAGVPSVDVIDLEYGAWHTPGDTLDAVSARSLQVVGDVILAALPQIEARVVK
jgi:glutaminyl-peptide cyclotransferase